MCVKFCIRSSRGLMLPTILAYSVLLLYLLNALGLYEWWNSMKGSRSSIVVKIIPGFGFVCGLTGNRTCQVLSKVTVLTVLAWVSLRWDFISATRDCSRHCDQICWAACIGIHSIILQKHYWEMNVMVLNKLSAVVSIKSSFGAIQMMERSSIALLLNKNSLLARFLPEIKWNKAIVRFNYSPRIQFRFRFQRMVTIKHCLSETKG